LSSRKRNINSSTSLTDDNACLYVKGMLTNISSKFSSVSR
jgi:hypothetical protein